MSAEDYLKSTGVYDHLTDVLLTVIQEQPADAVDAFEALSASTKQKPAEQPAPLPVHAKTADVTATLTTLFPPAPPAPPAEGEEPAEVEEVPINEEVDIVPIPTSMFEKVGVGFGAAETHRVALAVKKLGQNAELALESVRFWGKIFGTQADYLVCECKGGADEEAEEGEPDPMVVPPDAAGTGCNKFTYYVCNAPGSAWTKLPMAKPDCIMAARSIKKLFTGDLSAKIEGYPVFPGVEADYLRSQIALITSDTGIAPAGFYKLEDDWEEDPEDKTPDPPIAQVEAEEFVAPTAITALTDGSGWVHSYRQLLTRQGKCSWYAFPVPEEEEAEEGAEPAPKPEPETPEPSATPLAPLSADASVGPAGVAAPAWSFRAVLPGMAGSTVAVAKSTKWPGAVTVGELSGPIGLQWASVYIGTGTAYEGEPYSPPLPPPVAEEADDLFEEQDPTVEEEEAANAPPAEEENEEA